MPLTLMYITNRPDVAAIAEATGVDRIFVDLEYLGKTERQRGRDFTQTRHTVADVAHVRRRLNRAKLLVRINPLHAFDPFTGGSSEEIERVLDAGADAIMLPMYRTADEAEHFLRMVDGRAATVLLTETPEACGIVSYVASLPETDEIHIGLNDLHLALGRKFLFELLADGTVDRICDEIRPSGTPFGVGGIARISYGLLPAEYVIGEHYRLGSTRAILSRSFCNADKMTDTDAIRALFATETARIRETERQAAAMTPSQREENHRRVAERVKEIIKTM